MIASSLFAAVAGFRLARVADAPAGACVIGRQVYGYHPVQSIANDPRDQVANADGAVRPFHEGGNA